MILIVQVLITFSAVMGVTSYSRLSKDVENMLAMRLEHIARTASMVLRPEHQKVVIQRVYREDAQVHLTPEFKDEQRLLQDIRKKNDLATDVYTLTLNPKLPDKMQFVTMSNSVPYAGNAMDLHPLVKAVFDTGRPTHTGLYSDENGSWVSAFAPIFDSKNKVVSVLEVDYSAEAELLHLKTRLVRDLITSVVVGFVLSIFLGRLIAKTLTDPIQNLFNDFLLAAQGDLSARKESTRADEIGGLTRAFNQMLEQLRNQKQSLADYSKNLENKVQDRTAALQTATERIQSMLNSLTQGFFMFNAEGQCLDMHSLACEKILGKKPANIPIWEAIGIDDQKSIARLQTWVELLFDPLSDFEDVAALGPKVTNNRSGLHITLKYYPVRSESDGQVSTVVVVATDLTLERDAKIRADREAAYSQAILRIMRNRGRFLEFLRDAKVTFARMVEELEKIQPDVHVLFRLIHTFKSASGYFSLYEVTTLAHQLESHLSTIRNAKNEGRDARIDSSLEFDLTLLEEQLNTFIQANRDVIGISGDTTERTLELKESRVLHFRNHLLSKHSDPETLRVFTESFLQEKIVDSFEFYNHVVGLEAARLEKEVQPLSFTNGHILILADRFRPLFSSMIHIFRNAVAHGLETPRERRELGKPSTGRVWVNFSLTENNWIRITINDDGRGISPDKIRASLKEKGFPNWDGATDDQIIQRIFEPGFSTAQEVTELSGRGVGLDAVKNEVQLLGGSVWVESFPGRGTSFTVEFPKEQAA